MILADIEVIAGDGIGNTVGKYQEHNI